MGHILAVIVNRFRHCAPYECLYYYYDCFTGSRG